jgi:hypothetical protein
MEMQAGFWRRHRWLKWIGGGLLAAFAVLTGAVLVLAHRAEPILRAYIVQGLQDHFHARVELDSFHLTLRDGMWAEGKGLRIWPPAEVEGVRVPGSVGPPTPLIRLDEFRFHAPLDYKSGQAIRISVVQLKGLQLEMRDRRRPLIRLLARRRRAQQARQTEARGCCAFRWIASNATERT